MGRIEKINEQLRREISVIIQRELTDPRLELVTITEVITSRDLRHAKVYFSVLGDPKKVQESQNGLTAARGLIRKLAGQRMKVRYIPEFLFVHDKTLEISARIEAALEEIHNESKKVDEDYSEK